MTEAQSAAEVGKIISEVRADDGARNRGTGPAFALALLAPIVAEVLSGATRISYIFVLVPEIMVWGCGALIIREIVRRRHLPWTSMLLMGLGLSIAEEFLIQQTSLAPLPWISGPIYGRALGVNWLYFLFMLGYESVWVVLVPVHLTEMTFWRRRDQPWLPTRALIISALIFVIGSCAAWYSWIKRARPMLFHVPAYATPRVTLLLGLVAIVGLVIVALSLRERPRTPAVTPPGPWLIALAALAFGFSWYVLLGFIFTPNFSLRALPFWVPMLAGIAWAMAAFVLFSRWSSSSRWDGRHRYALIFAAILVCMIAGFLGSSAWPRIDVIGKSILDIVAVILLLALGRVQQKRWLAPAP